MAVPAASDLPDDLDATIAALEAARRLRVPAESVDFEALLDAVETQGPSG